MRGVVCLLLAPVLGGTRNALLVTNAEHVFDEIVVILAGDERLGVEPSWNRAAKPTDRACIESFNGKFRAECLNAHRSLTVDEIRVKYSAIGNKTPMELHRMAASPASVSSEVARIFWRGWSKDGGKFSPGHSRCDALDRAILEYYLRAIDFVVNVEIANKATAF